jgi:hypothetical protein
VNENVVIVVAVGLRRSKIRAGNSTTVPKPEILHKSFSKRGKRNRRLVVIQARVFQSKFIDFSRNSMLWKYLKKGNKGD